MNAATQAKGELRKHLIRVGILIELEEHMKEYNTPPKVNSDLGKRLTNLFNAAPWTIWTTYQEVKKESGT
ncbi:hypothetical protein KAR91_44615 [Candidatus Pacearchaeota archaeon]|nr:hypothetical protein [Candidatus Pacearchaeota archaeon]